MPKPNPMGSTFAERAAATRGDKDFDAPVAGEHKAVTSTTFLERANVESKGTVKKAPAKKTAKKG